MTLNDLLALFSDDYKKKLEAKRMARTQALMRQHLGTDDKTIRDSQGRLLRQGLGGFYSDHLPYTLEDYLNERSPEFMREIRAKPKGRSQYEIESDWRDPLTYVPKGKYL